MVRHAIDPTRDEPLSGIAGDRRRVSLSLFFPVRPGATAAVAPTVPERRQIKAWLRGNDWPDDEALILADRYGALSGNAVAASEPIDDRLPLVLFSPGGYQSRHHYRLLCEHIASHGYLVAAVSHPYAGLDYFPDLGLLGRHPRWTARGGENHQGRDEFYDAMTEVLVGDLQFVLDSQEGLPAILTRRVIRDAVGLVGHSRGGRPSSRLAVVDRRIAATALLDNLPPSPDRVQGHHGAVMLMRVGDWATDDHWARPGGSPRWTLERLAAARRLIAEHRGPAYDVAISGIGHMSFSDRPLIEPERFRSPRAPDQAFRAVSSLLLAFLDRHLKDAGPAELPRLPGTEIFSNRP